MKKSKVWDFWARRYEGLWVQKYSLKPTRSYILRTITEFHNRCEGQIIKVLDLGCGPGELISELNEKFDNLEITGIDFSEGMLDASRKRNPSAKHIKMDADDLYKLNEKFNIIICTHSLPYYKNPAGVMEELDRLSYDDGRIYFGFGSGNSFYDKFVLSFVKLTTGPANYPSHEKFLQLIESYFQVENLQIVKERFYMPRIAIYTLKKASV